MTSKPDPYVYKLLSAAGFADNTNQKLAEASEAGWEPYLMTANEGVVYVLLRRDRTNPQLEPE